MNLCIMLYISYRYYLNKDNGFQRNNTALVNKASKSSLLSIGNGNMFQDVKLNQSKTSLIGKDFESDRLD